MEFVRGNRAIRDHIQSGKDLHLFQYVASGIVRYVDQMVCSGYEFREALDVDGNSRRAIIFHLVPIETFEEIEDNFVLAEEQDLTLNELRQQALSVNQFPSEPRVSFMTTYIRSEAVRDYVLMRAAGTCEACGGEAPFLTAAGRPFLETHHIRRLSDGGPDHPAWVAGVCPNCHRRAHFANDREEFNLRLQEIVNEKEQNILL